LVSSQEINIEKDSIPNIVENPYIEDHDEQLNIKFDVTNDIINYSTSFEGETATLSTNLKNSFGFVFSYKFLSLRLGVRPSLSKNEKKDKGETDYFRFRIKLLFDNWIHNLEYNYRRGFYIEGSQNTIDEEGNPNFHVQFPNLTTNTISGSSQYKFNKNYSFKAIESNTEIQLKSAGTFMPGISYTYYDVSGTDKIKNSNNETELREAYSESNGFSIILNSGYYHTFVLHNYWYANIYANPGVGINYYNATTYSANTSVRQSFDKVFFSFKSGAAAGYNGQKYYFGLEFNYQSNSNFFDFNNINLKSTRANFHVFVGYRFKAPKQITKPINKIEEKIPILKGNQ
jgi:hypothetical protein